VEVAASVDAPHPAAAVFPWIADLDRYPAWLEIVRRAEPDGPGAWIVDLRARLGPLARSKRLRMVRTVLEPDRHARFERREVDGRDHAAWVLEAHLEPADGGSRLSMSLRYDGGSLAPIVQRILADEIERSRRRLLDRIAGAA
jgi:hypothetical protein